MLVVALTAVAIEVSATSRKGTVRMAVATYCTYFTKGNLMNDLNMATNEGWSGWQSLEYWMGSVEYWSQRLAEEGDINGYAKSVDVAWDMVTLELTGDLDAVA